MRSSKLVFTAAVLTATMFGFAAICGEANTEQSALQSQPEAPASPPPGLAAKLRLHAEPAAIACGETARIDIFLDDLPDTPPARDPGGPTGLSGYSFWFTYDRNVVQVARPDDVTPNKALDAAEPANAIREWIANSPIIRNDEGATYLVAIDWGVDPNLPAPPEGDADVSKLVTGLRPSAQGSPILLTSISVTAVGAGDTSLTIQKRDLFEIEVLNGSGTLYEPVDVTRTAVSVTGDCKAAPVAMATGIPGTPAPRVPVISRPAEQGGPHPLPTGEPGCEWSVISESPNTPEIKEITSPCYRGSYLFDERDGSLIPFPSGPASPVVCLDGSDTTDPKCARVHEVMTAVAGENEAR